MKPQKIMIKSQDQIDPIYKNIHPPYEYTKFIVKPGEDGSCCVTIYEIPPAKAGYPYHYHSKNEEIFYILSGQGILETPDGEKPVKPGDFIICPAGSGGAHKLTNSSGDEILRYIDFDTVHIPETAFYPHSKKIGVVGFEGSNFFYPFDAQADYYDGE
jgi:uncharacterized cupin superfamily protein